MVPFNIGGCIYLRGKIQKIFVNLSFSNKILSTKMFFYLYHLKKMIENKVRVEGLICNVYLIEEAASFFN